MNTDFAETEVDIRQVNLTRFPLFFPEKRTFFLEGAGVFDVAGLANTTNIRPFFSRRIGLVDTATEDSVAVPLRVGAKLTGRQSDYNIGVLDVETGSQFDIALPGGSVSPQNLMAARVSRNILQQSWVGGIVTHGNPTGAGNNTLFGADARFATSTFRGNKNLSLALYLLGTDDEASRTRAGAGGAGAGARPSVPCNVPGHRPAGGTVGVGAHRLARGEGYARTRDAIVKHVTDLLDALQHGRK